jgi:hypothetical protein
MRRHHGAGGTKRREKIVSIEAELARRGFYQRAKVQRSLSYFLPHVDFATTRCRDGSSGRIAIGSRDLTEQLAPRHQR